MVTRYQLLQLQRQSVHFLVSLLLNVYEIHIVLELILQLRS